jgi:hypothetical protein
MRRMGNRRSQSLRRHGGAGGLLPGAGWFWWCASCYLQCVAGIGYKRAGLSHALFTVYFTSASGARGRAALPLEERRAAPDSESVVELCR